MSRLAEEVAGRQTRLAKLRTRGISPYPALAARTHTLAEIARRFEALQKSGKILTVDERVRAIRKHGGAIFATVENGADRLQLYVRRDHVGEEAFSFFADLMDIGDIIEASGTLMTTKRGERTLLVDRCRMLTKSLFPLPEKWHGLKDIEVRYRKRELDLIVNTEIRDDFIKRAKILERLRSFFLGEQFLEVQTPILQPIAGGATARPFVTHHHALETDLFLRIAPELYLKRLVVGGLERVFEIGPCFRNEGIDTLHNPEFSQVEAYAAYWTLEDMTACTERLFRYLLDDPALFPASAKNGMDVAAWKPPFAREDFQVTFLKHTKINIDAYPTAPALAAAVRKQGITIGEAKSLGRGTLLDAVVKSIIRPKLQKPTFLMNYPKDMSPLAKSIDDRPDYVHRFQLFIEGMEIANAFGELNDPQEQEERFAEQERLRRGGDEEAQRRDEDFLDALRVGMPPTAGIGIGIERLMMLLLRRPAIRDVMLFPVLRKKSEDKDHD